jgi:hypothetical protein
VASTRKISREQAIELCRIRTLVEEYADGLKALGERLDAIVFGAHGPQSGVVPDSIMDADWNAFLEEVDAAEPEAVNA